jgi:hypothetical protein
VRLFPTDVDECVHGAVQQTMMRGMRPDFIITPKSPSINNLMKSLMANESEVKKSNDEGISLVAPPLPGVSNMAWP